VRPAAVVAPPIGDDVILAFITSRAESVDPLTAHVLRPEDPDFAATGLRVSSTIRLNKLATLHRRVVRRRLGELSPSARGSVSDALRYVFEL
jgi:mRNA interferase MazF